MLEHYIGKNLKAFTENDVVRLAKVYRSLKDGVIGSEYFTERIRDVSEPEAVPASEAVGVGENVDAEQVDLNDI